MRFHCTSNSVIFVDMYKTWQSNYKSFGSTHACTIYIAYNAKCMQCTHCTVWKTHVTTEASINTANRFDPHFGFMLSFVLLVFALFLSFFFFLLYFLYFEFFRINICVSVKSSGFPFSPQFLWISSVFLIAENWGLSGCMMGISTYDGLCKSPPKDFASRIFFFRLW